ncbi:hypothetical protein A6B39_08425 [Mannheimia granulomatis]|nr:hypothetical protein A6B39_08425 [Mannheimia granulomatis]
MGFCNITNNQENSPLEVKKYKRSVFKKNLQLFFFYAGNAAPFIIGGNWLTKLAEDNIYILA